MNKGVIYAFSAYLLWGFFPVYFKLIGIVPPLQILAHRFLWSFIFLTILILGLKQLPRLKSSITRRILISYFIAGSILAVNWGTYVYAVNSGHVLESSLGYFINPIVSVLLGVIFLKERLRLWQWIPVGLAAAGVVYLTIIFGSIPWIALVLAFSFGLYGLIKKLSPLDSLAGLTLETGLLFIPAVAFLGFHEVSGTGSFGHTSPWIGVLLALSGVVTAIPLLLFAAGTKRINLTTIGILQYITPTIQFLLGAFLFKEPFDTNRLVGFALIWLALVIFTGETVLNQRNKKFFHTAPIEVVIPE